jgi:hypothetical protein
MEAYEKVDPKRSNAGISLHCFKLSVFQPFLLVSGDLSRRFRSVFSLSDLGSFL